MNVVVQLNINALPNMQFCKTEYCVQMHIRWETMVWSIYIIFVINRCEQTDEWTADNKHLHASENVSYISEYFYINYSQIRVVCHMESAIAHKPGIKYNNQLSSVARPGTHSSIRINMLKLIVAAPRNMMIRPEHFSIWPITKDDTVFTAPNVIIAYPT